MFNLTIQLHRSRGLQAWLVITALLLLDANGPTPLKRQPTRTCKDLPYWRQWLPALLFVVGSRALRSFCV